MSVVHPWLLESWPTKKMPREALEDRIAWYLTTQNMGVLATHGPRGTIASPLEFYADHLTPYFVPQPRSPKIANLRENPTVCLAVFNQFVGWASARGVQIFGKAVLIPPDSPEHPRAMQVYRWKGSAAELGCDLTKTPPLTLCKIVPDRITLTEHWLRKDGYAPRQVWRAQTTLG